jgi:hypothetical protein
MLLIENEMTVSKVSKIMGVNPQRIWNVFDYWISKAHSNDRIANIEKIGFDETSIKKGHLNIKEQVQRNNLMNKYKNLNDGYTLVQMFKDFWNIKGLEQAKG